MAARLELYGVVDGHHLEQYDDLVLLHATQAGAAQTPATATKPAFLGFVSANDADEQLLFDLLSAVADRSSIDARQHGCGLAKGTDVADTADSLGQFVIKGLPGLTFADDATVVRGWAHAIAGAAQVATKDGTDLAWRMLYDRAGSTDDGADEFPTGHS